MQCTGIILGAGIIGSAIAFELSRRGIANLHVFDPDLEGSLSSTERNAGGVRHLWQHQVNIELARRSIQFFEGIRNEVGFNQKGYLWLISKNDHAMGRMLTQHIKKNALPYETLEVTDIKKKYPFIDKTEDLQLGIFGPRDGLVNSNAIKCYFRKEAQKKGVVFHDRTWGFNLKERKGFPQIDISLFNSQEKALECLKNPHSVDLNFFQTWQADFIILSTGPWAEAFLKPILKPTCIKPIRRQVSIFKSASLDLTPYGMVVDSSKVYFHPEGGNILAGFVLPNEKEGYHFHYDSNYFEESIWPALFNRSTSFENLKEVSGWGGLYSYTPDTTGVLGHLPGFQNVYEAHSYTGRGVMQSYGVAGAVADLVLKQSFDFNDFSLLSRERFKDPRTHLFEALHI